MYPGKVGRDHLGLASVSQDQILPTLSPGINVLTIHPRYHGFYVFLLDEYWRRDRPRSRNAFSQFYRPREFIFSVGAHLCDEPEHGSLGDIIGSQKTDGLARRRLPRYDTTADYIKSDLGGYGLYYRSVMAELGLIYPGGPGFPTPVDVPTEKGKELAAAFRQAVENTVYFREYFGHDATEVPIAAIQEYIRSACLCQLQRSDAPDRPQLLDCFLHGGSAPNAQARRATFRLFLDIASQTHGYAVDQIMFRQLLFFGATDSGARYQSQMSVVETHQVWRLYQAREYYAFALNAMWYYLCGWGVEQGGEFHPIPITHFWDHLDAALDFDALANHLSVPPPGLGARSNFEDLLDWLKRLIGAGGPAFDMACTIDAPVHEHRLYRLALLRSDGPEVMAAGMLTLLALLFLRFGLPDRWLKPDWSISKMGYEGRLSVDGFVRAVRRRLDRRVETIGDMARWLYADYVILQHQIVATGKLPENTFRFQREGDRLHFYRLYNTLDLADSRFDAISTTVHELGLCGSLDQPAHALTSDGQRLLETGDLS
ncbi:MAG: hypothetical protein M3R24_16270 [Chloroflexota bacterium]|nr:hypothetical protein [Chloroflexota bacterium]